ncbi:SLAP2 protein, partial [Podilymbus podiceps]|nr:SLAP2 protein [Podilymbus podiceps]
PLTFPRAPNDFLALALCDFPSSRGLATILRMGEPLCVLSEDSEWWLVASKVSGKECHVPSSCAAKVSHRWLYEGVSQQKAEELLLQPGNRSGSFLVWESQTRQAGGCPRQPGHLSPALCPGRLLLAVSAPQRTFPSLQDFLDHYSEFGERLCCPLGEPCSMEVARVELVPTMPAVVRKPSLDWDKIDSSLLFSEAMSPQEDSPLSLGLREAISSYLLLAERAAPKQGPAGNGANRS